MFVERDKVEGSVMVGLQVSCPRGTVEWGSKSRRGGVANKPGIAVLWQRDKKQSAKIIVVL